MSVNEARELKRDISRRGADEGLPSSSRTDSPIVTEVS